MDSTSEFYMRSLSDISPQNHLLLNKIVRRLLQSLKQQMLEFIDVLLDGFTSLSINKRNLVVSLVTDTKLPLFDEQDNMVFCDLGFTDLAGIVRLREYIQQLEGVGGVEEAVGDYVPCVLSRIDLIHRYFVYLLECLSSYVEQPLCTESYKTILAAILPCFQLFFTDVRTFKRIVNQLMLNACETGYSDSSPFEVSNAIISEIEQLRQHKSQFRGIVAGLEHMSL